MRPLSFICAILLLSTSASAEQGDGYMRALTLLSSEAGRLSWRGTAFVVVRDSSLLLTDDRLTADGELTREEVLGGIENYATRDAHVLRRLAAYEDLLAAVAGKVRASESCSADVPSIGGLIDQHIASRNTAWTQAFPLISEPSSREDMDRLLSAMDDDTRAIFGLIGDMACVSAPSVEPLPPAAVIPEGLHDQASR